MKAVFLKAKNTLVVGTKNKPGISKPTDVLVKIKFVGVCGSDVHYFLKGAIGRQVVRFPFILGHECSGVVEEVGSRVTKVRVGQHVAIDPAVPCHHCDQCLSGRFNTCRNLLFLACPEQLDGSLQEYLVMPEECMYPLPERISLEQGALIEPLTIGYYSVKLSQLKAGQTAVILGQGPIGLSVLLMANLRNPKAIYTTELIPNRVTMSLKMGATQAYNSNLENSVEKILNQEKGGVDVVYECAGQQETIDQGTELLKPGGRLVLVGIPEGERIWCDIDKLRRKEITIQNVRRQNLCTQLTIDIIVNAKLNLKPFITHRFSPEQTQKAFEMVAQYRDGVLKALIEWN